VFIYGLANDIDVSEQGNSAKTMDVKIKITGYTAPMADWSPSNYDWMLEIFEYRSNTVIA
jgi:hypothetical protein